MPSLCACSLALLRFIALAGALMPSVALAQTGSMFQPTVDPGTTRSTATFQQQMRPASDRPTRFGEMQSGGNDLTTGQTSRSGQGARAAGTTSTNEQQAQSEEAEQNASAGLTGFDSSNARKKKAARRAARASQRPPQLSAADADAARAIARGPQQLYTRSVVLPEPGAATGTLPPVIVPVRRRPPPDVDPYAPIGVRAGSFLLFPSVELIGGYDSNPLRRQNAPSSGVVMAVPELKVQSQWLRHELKAELRGTYYSYSRTFEDVQINNPGSGVPRSLDRPDFEGKVNGKLDTHGRSHADAEARFTVGTDNPGSPNITAGLDRLPIYTRVGGSLGYTQNFNRFELSGKGGVDRIDYTSSKFTDGTTASNDDRNYNQYSASLRGSYELRPGVTPFAEVAVDQRVHDLKLDRNGLDRGSDSVTGRVGSTFELARQLTGEVSAGYLTRRYKDPSLKDLSGFVADASLIWLPSALTTVTLTGKSASDESIVADISGVLRRDVTLQVDHAWRRWLIGTVRGGLGLDEYQSTGVSRQDQRFFLAAAIVYKMSRDWQVKGEVRRDWLDSNVATADYAADTFLVGVKWQR